ncbi:hypothetical protein ACRRTK_006570 [Alexandromys fortis]
MELSTALVATAACSLPHSVAFGFPFGCLLGPCRANRKLFLTLRKLGVSGCMKHTVLPQCQEVDSPCKAAAKALALKRAYKGMRLLSRRFPSFETVNRMSYPGSKDIISLEGKGPGSSDVLMSAWSSHSTYILV